MSVAQALKIYEQIGLPILVAAVSAYALWFCLKWVLVKFSTDFTRQLTEIAAEIDEEQRDVREQITEVKTILIRLVDRTRLLAEELNAHDQVARTVWNISEKIQRPQTRAELRDELEERLRAIGKNGDD